MESVASLASPNLITRYCTRDQLWMARSKALFAIDLQFGIFDCHRRKDRATKVAQIHNRAYFLAMENIFGRSLRAEHFDLHLAEPIAIKMQNCIVGFLGPKFLFD